VLIVGNSHVSVFSNGCILPEEPDESVGVHWVGALEVEHFFNGHPAARKVRELFQGEGGWKFLMIGNHDIFRLFQIAAQHGYAAALDHMVSRYRSVFSELSAGGKFAWLIGLQQADNVSFAGVSPSDILAASRELVARVGAWCEGKGIPVIDPTSSVCGPDGRPERRWLQADGLHLKASAARFYFERFEQQMGLRVLARHARGTDFEPLTEHESFCSLVLGELALPPERGPEVDLPAEVLAFSRQRLDDRGLEFELDLDTDFVSSGLFDSLDLVELYTFATESLGQELDFDVALRELETVRKLCAYLGARMPPASDADLVLADFVQSMRGASEDERTLRAEEHIARMGAVRAALLLDAIETAGGGASYGLPLYWVALALHAEGEREEAMRLLDMAGHPNLRFPVAADRVAKVRRRWQGSPSERAALPRKAAPVSILPDARAFNVVTVAGETGPLRAWILAFLVAFGPSDDVALHVFAGDEVERVSQLALEAIAELGADPEAIADICVVPGLPGLEHVRVADLIFGSGRIQELARVASRPCFEAVSDLWRQAATSMGVNGQGSSKAVEVGTAGLTKPGHAFRVSAIVSTYNSERFMRGCLESLVNQSLGEAVEIIVIDSGSPQNERAIVEEFQKRHPNIVYVRTERESLYEAWSRGVRLARAPYVTNANTDDRLFANALEVLADTLDANPEVMLAYADQFVTDTPEVGPDTCRFVGAFHLDEFDRYTMLDKCYVGPQPMWRRSVHDEVGYFDSRYRSAGDYEFWLRIARRFPLLHVPQRLGVYFQNDQGIELSNTGLSREEGMRAIASYVPAYLTPAELLVPDGRFRLVAPLRGGDVTGWVTGIVDAYLQACSPGDPVTLFLVVDPSLADDLVLSGLVTALARQGLTLEDAFADISLVRMPPVELLAWAPVLAAGDRILVNPLDAPMSLLVEDLGLRPPLEPEAEAFRSALAIWDVSALDVACWVVPDARHPGARIRECLDLPGRPRVTVVEGTATEELDLDGIHGRIRVFADSLVGLTPAMVSSRSDVFVVSIAYGDLPPIDPDLLTAMVQEMRRDPDLGVLALEGAALWIIRTRFHVDPVRSLEQLLEDVRSRGGKVAAWTPGTPVVAGA